ncbi:hypothetical protein LCGC14_2319410 [marine sediment metagenome]|uniref:Calcineurin-like phosphoesterase domain-containing protein n=1 Tax=marine sediment metagenome TaxID=412755 RepID=A0A0F9EVQ6_9ZZZZ
MEVKEVWIKYRSRKAEYHIYPIGDIHAGVKHCAEAMIRKRIREIQDDPMALVIGMGDYADYVTPNDKRWDDDVVSIWVDKGDIGKSQEDWVVELFRPIKSKIMGLLSGNHEQSIRLSNNTRVHGHICERLGVTDLGYTAYVRITFTRSNGSAYRVTCFFTHGSGWAITKGAKLNKLQRVMDSFEADIYAVGHMHDIITDTKPYLALNEAGELKQREKVGAITGSWFKTYEQGVPASYGERKVYPPTSLGAPIFTIIPDKKILSVEG